MKTKRPLTICVFGSYDEKVLSTALLLSGLSLYDQGHKIVYVHEKLPSGAVYDASHLALLHIYQRTINRLKSLVKLTLRIPDILQCDVLVILPFGLFDLVLAAPYKYLLRKKVIYIPQNSLYHLLVYAYKNHLNRQRKIFIHLIYLIERFLFHIPNLVVFNTKAEVKYYTKLLNLPNLHTAVVPLGADDSIFIPSARKITNETFEILFYGEYNLTHGVDIIVGTAILLRKHKNIHFTFIGEGRTKQKIVSMVRRRKLKYISFIGWLKPQELVKHIHKADVVLGMFNNDEALNRLIPNKVYQGLACAKCVITGSSAAVKEVLRHKKDIYLVKPSSPKSLAQGILNLKRNKHLRDKLKQNGYKTYVKNFSRKPTVEKLLSEIERLFTK